MRSIYPDDVSGLNTEANFVPKTTLLLKLVAGEGWSLVWDGKIDTVTRDGAVCSSIPFEPNVPNDLDKMVSNNNNEQARNSGRHSHALLQVQ